MQLVNDMDELEKSVSKFRDYLNELQNREELFAVALSELGSSERAIRWLLTPQQSLDGRLPLECGDDEVKEVLLAIEHGVYL